jgi:flagellar biogenesis protein FliO
MPLPILTIASSVLALAAVLGLVVLAGRVLRGAGFAGFRPSARLALRESLVIDRNRSLRIVTCDARELLLLVGGSSDVVIGWLPPAHIGAPTTSCGANS